MSADAQRRQFGLTESSHNLRVRLEDARRNKQIELAERLLAELARRNERAT